jgi:hypothetical protein
MIEGDPIERLYTRLSPKCEWIDYGAPFHTAEGIYQMADNAHLDLQKCASVS